ncbi:MAG: hypothetical protein ACJ8FY_04000 [Gemmataceae bacterium]
MIHLPHTLAGLADICADQSARYSMSGVHVTDRGHAYELVATDGKRLVLVQGLNERNPLPNEVIEAADDSETSAVIAADDWALTSPNVIAADASSCSPAPDFGQRDSDAVLAALVQDFLRFLRAQFQCPRRLIWIGHFDGRLVFANLSNARGDHPDPLNLTPSGITFRRSLGLSPTDDLRGPVRCLLDDFVAVVALDGEKRMLSRTGGPPVCLPGLSSGL